MTKQKIIAITGPSASGKTKLSIELAKKIDGEIISVDSRQIYKELDIGSAKPTLKEQDGIPHYLMDIIDLNQEYTVANFCDDANIKIKEIINKGKVPILVGGTGLYFRVLLQDFDYRKAGGGGGAGLEYCFDLHQCGGLCRGEHCPLSAASDGFAAVRNGSGDTVNCYL